MNEKPEPLTQAELDAKFPLPDEFGWWRNKGLESQVVRGIRRSKTDPDSNRPKELWFGWICAADERGFAARIYDDMDRADWFPTAEGAYAYIYNQFVFNRPEDF